jgi:hypothetical protein
VPRGKIVIKKDPNSLSSDAELDVTILSVKKWQPVVTIGGSTVHLDYFIPYGSAEPIEVSASRFYPNTTDLQIRKEWALPANMSSPQGSGSTFLTGYSTHSIQIIPTNSCVDFSGSLRVRALNDCTVDTAWSDHRIVSIKRSIPNPAIFPKNNTIQWGTQTPITFTANNTSTAGSYEWQALEGFTVSGPLPNTSQSVSLTPTGCVQARVRVRAVYCNDKFSAWDTAFVNITVPTISGDDMLNVQKQYSIQGLPTGTTASWTTGGYLSPSSATTTTNHTVTFSPTISSGCQSSWIDATISRNGCVRGLSRKNVGVGSAPNANLISSTYNGYTFTSFPQFIVDDLTYNGQPLWQNSQGMTSGSWSYTSGGGGIDPIEADCMHSPVVPGSCANIWIGNSGNVIARLANQCGWSNWVTITYGESYSPPTCYYGVPYCTGWCSDCSPIPVCPLCFQNLCVCIVHICPVYCHYGCWACLGFCHNCHDDDCDGIRCGWQFTFSPNPVSDELTIEFRTLQTEIDQAVTHTVKLLDNSGRIVRETKFNHRRRDGKAKPVKFNTTGLREGTYYLHVDIDGKVEKVQIIVKRK